MGMMVMMRRDVTERRAKIVYQSEVADIMGRLAATHTVEGIDHPSWKKLDWENIVDQARKTGPRTAGHGQGSKETSEKL